jgi:lysine-specific demethylase 3
MHQKSNNNSIESCIHRKSKPAVFLVLDVNDKNKSDNYLFENFDNEWLNKKPVLIKNNHLNMNRDLWSPDSFRQEFGDLIVDLINCRNGKLIRQQKMTEFWCGFEDFDSRIRDEKGRPIICKLKDWPTTDDFKNVLESRYNDLMTNLPIPQYSHRDGPLNLSSYLPESFLKPDLGPKMYIAYSSADTPKDGTTSLHIDISDAVNIMMYVGGEAFVASDNPQQEIKKKRSPKNLINDLDKNTNINQIIYDILKKTKCDETQLQRFIHGEKPGALWHIFKPEDADKIRNYFSVVSV